METVSAFRILSLGGRVRGHGRGIRVALGVRWGQGEAHQRALGAPGAMCLSRSCHQRDNLGHNVPGAKDLFVPARGGDCLALRPLVVAYMFRNGEEKEIELP